ncbi:methyltransferase, partial [Escherichia coli]
IGHMGAMPDIKSHQFYPSSARLSEYVASIIAAGEGERLLEPNIGHGDLLQCFPKSVNVTGIELDTLNCLVSRAKGYETTEADFLAWSAANQIQKFDCVVMNPPFADNRAKLHLLAAASHLVPGGRLAAVLPLSLQGIDNLLGEGFRTEWMDTFDNEFDNTAVSVRVLYAERF